MSPQRPAKYQLPERPQDVEAVHQTLIRDAHYEGMDERAGKRECPSGPSASQSI